MAASFISPRSLSESVLFDWYARGPCFERVRDVNGSYTSPAGLDWLKMELVLPLDELLSRPRGTSSVCGADADDDSEPNIEKDVLSGASILDGKMSDLARCKDMPGPPLLFPYRGDVLLPYALSSSEKAPISGAASE